ncbi:hypothetical protein [Streptomyces californicus]
MEIAELVLKYVDTLVWPVATVALVWGLRHPIKRAIARLSRLETPAGTMEFTEETREVLGDAVAIVETTTASSDANERAEVGSRAEEQRSPHDTQDEYLKLEFLDAIGLSRERMEVLRLRQSTSAEFHRAAQKILSSPPEAVLFAWSVLRRECENVMRGDGVDVPLSEVRADAELAGKLREFGTPADLLHVFERLSLLHQSAVRRPETVMPEAAVNFIRSCNRVVEGVRRAAPGAPV